MSQALPGLVALCVMVAIVVTQSKMLAARSRRVRAEVSAQAPLFAAPALEVMVTQSGFLKFRHRHVRADVIVSGSHAALFPDVIGISQQPIRLYRKRSDASMTPELMIDDIVLVGAPSIEKGRVLVRGEGIAAGRWTLVITTDRPRELRDALLLFQHP